jgi:hypothetical protein
MRELRCGWTSRWQATLALASLVVWWACILEAPAGATEKYGPLEISGNLETQNLVRDPSLDKFQFIQNRNTFRLRFDYDWLQKGRLIDRIDVPWIERSKLFVLYRGVYDGFYDLAPTDRQLGQTRFDDLVGGPINGHDIGQVNPQSGQLLPGQYSRLSDSDRTNRKFENRLREAYVDLKLKDLPVSFRLGRQQVIWGESDQFRLMDIWNPLDLTWHLQQESWDNIRIPLWLGKGLWDIGNIGPFSNTFLEVVYNPFDFQPNQKIAFLPNPWSVPYPDPLRDGQVEYILGSPFATRFNLHGTSFQNGDFHRNPQDASEFGTRFHTVTPQGLELSADYLYARGRAVGAGSPQGIKINSVTPCLAGPNCRVLDSNGNPATFVVDNGQTVFNGRSRNGAFNYLDVDAEVKFPYNHIFGLTGNYFEGDYTSAVFRFETAYVLGEPVQTIEQSKLPAGVPQTMDKRDLWAGMIGFDRPTWIRWLNSKSTWFLTGQVFWNYYNGATGALRGVSGAGETPYCTPGDPLCAPASAGGSRSSGVGTWASGPFAGTTERVQSAELDPSGNKIRRWEHLITLAATTFYRGGTVVPFVADAWDPVNDNNEVLWNVDYFYTNNFIITLQQKFFMTYGSKAPSDDPWGAAGLNDRRDETGVKVTYQF